jgi:hypothetical protein
MSKSKQPSGSTQIDRTSRRATPRQHGPSVTLRIIIVIRNDRVKLLIEITPEASAAATRSMSTDLHGGSSLKNRRTSNPRERSCVVGFRSL